MKRGQCHRTSSFRNTRSRSIIDDEILALLDAPDSENINGTAVEPALMLVDQSELDAISATADEVTHNDPDSDNLLTPSASICEDDDDDDACVIVSPAKKPKLDTYARGRTIDPVWSKFHKDDKLPNSKVKCNLCGKSVSKKVERLRAHLEKKCLVDSVSGRKSVPESFPTTPSRKLFKPSPKTRRSSLTSFVDRITTTEKEELDLEIGKYIFATNLPFTHVETPAFERLLAKIRPAYTLPKRKKIGGSILNKVYSEVIEKQNQELQGKPVTIMQDGWKNRTSEPIIAHSVTTGEKAYFFNAKNAEENEKTGSYCAKLLQDNIEEVKKLGAEVIAVVTDNCRSMEKMRRLISKTYPGIFTYGCSPHLLNLVGKRFTSSEIIDKIQLVHTFYRNHDAAWALLKKKGGGRPVLASETRWNAWIDSLQYYLDNHTKMLEVSRTPNSKITFEVSEIRNDGGFYVEVETMVRYLKPIQEALDSLQRENATLADAIKAWITLKPKLETRDIELNEYFMKQYEKALQPVGIGAYMIHPVYRGEGLTPDQIEIGNQFLSSQKAIYALIASQLHQKDEALFPPHLFHEEIQKKCNPVTWWKSLECLEKIDRNAIKFFTNLMSLPAGSADIERHFSVLGNIMNVRRARLGIEKAAKLCIIYKNLAGKCAPLDDGGDWDLPDE